MKCNYHTHTKRCMHAIGNDEEYVLAAIKNGYDVLGFSDHTPWNYNSDFIPYMRMRLEEFDEYYNSIKALKLKYQDQIEILIGVEAEYYPEYIDWFKDFIKEKKLDYVIFGNHYYISDERKLYFGNLTNNDEYLDEYLRYCIEGLKTGIYAYLAHPDLFMRGRHIFDEKAREISYKICEYAKDNDVILEYNLEGLRMQDGGRDVYYPHDEFWKIASEVGVKAIIGVDAHNPLSLSDDKYYNMAKEKLKEYHIEIVEKL